MNSTQICEWIILYQAFILVKYMNACIHTGKYVIGSHHTMRSFTVGCKDFVKDPGMD